MKIPYTKLELSTAFLEVSNLIDDDEKFVAEMDQATVDFVKEPTPQNVANHFGISTLDLANSPNRQQMNQEFMEFGVKAIINYLVSKKGFTDKQAWALIYAGTRD